MVNASSPPLTASGAGPSLQSDASVPGLAAAALWAVGFMAGVLALLTGHAAVAVAALVVAVAAPWFGLAWVSHRRRRVEKAPLGLLS